MFQRGLLSLLVGLGLGALVGALVGWFVPVQDVSVGLERLSPQYKAEYTLIVAAAYEANGDWDLAQARLGRLAEADPALYVVQVTEQAIAEGRSPADIRRLTAMAVRFGYTTPSLVPYLPAEGGS